MRNAEYKRAFCNRCTEWRERSTMKYGVCAHCRKKEIENDPSLSEPQRRLIGKLSAKWQDVPTVTRGRTIKALIQKGMIEHRWKPNEYHHYKDWLVWGQVRLPSKGNK